MKELTKEEVLDKNVSIDCNDLQYYGSGIYQAMQEYSDQNTKQLIDEIEQQKMQCSVYHNDILNLEDEIDKLKSDLKAAESVNEKLQSKLDIAIKSCWEDED